MVAERDWTWSANSRAGTYPGQGFFLIGKTEIFTFLRGSRRARPSPSPRSGHAKPENPPTSEDVGGIALDRSSLQPHPPPRTRGRVSRWRGPTRVAIDIMSGWRREALPGRPPRGALRAALPRVRTAAGPRRPQPGRATRREASRLTPAPGCAQLFKGLWYSYLPFFFSPFY